MPPFQMKYPFDPLPGYTANIQPLALTKSALRYQSEESPTILDFSIHRKERESHVITHVKQEITSPSHLYSRGQHHFSVWSPRNVSSPKSDHSENVNREMGQGSPRMGQMATEQEFFPGVQGSPGDVRYVSSSPGGCTEEKLELRLERESE